MTDQVDYFLLACASQASLQNAREFLEQAELMATRGWHGRAMAMAILGQEEVGKAFWQSQIAFGFLPADGQLLQAIRRKHWSKQLIAIALESLTGVVERLSSHPDAARIEADLKRDLKAAPGAAEESHRLAIVVGQMRHLKPLLEPFCREMATAWSALDAQLELIRDGTADAEKQRGLYVDIDESTTKVRTPSDVTPDETAREIRRLQEILASSGDTVPAAESQEQLAHVRQAIAPMMERWRANRSRRRAPPLQ
ncbi:MAG: AbiV family abortive infection protein [Planctomycetes bacterium]|nr:AbiV family abortive infection protein [Planctomycetota bacterium]